MEQFANIDVRQWTFVGMAVPGREQDRAVSQTHRGASQRSGNRHDWPIAWDVEFRKSGICTASGQHGRKRATLQHDVVEGNGARRLTNETVR